MFIKTFQAWRRAVYFALRLASRPWRATATDEDDLAQRVRLSGEW